MEKKIRVLTLSFDENIGNHEVQLLRGAVISCVGRDSSMLLHNHIDDSKYRYSYPLVQYKTIDHKASIVCIDEGINTLMQFISLPCESLCLGERKISITDYNISQSYTLLNTSTEMFSYTLHSWIPFNDENYKKYRSLRSITDIIGMLENILKGNILSMCKGLGVYLEHELTVSFTEIEDPHVVRKKGTPLLAFNVDFDTNILLPENIGLGKSVSIGYGTVTRIRHKKTY